MTTNINILLASSNQGKIKEFNNYFADTNINFVALKNKLGENIENGHSFVENATKKIEASQEQIKLYTQEINYILADDSGLCVKSLNNKPGIYSARYFGTGEGLNNLIKELENKNNRQAYFVCSLVLLNISNNKYWKNESCWHGKIASKISGTNGFGYDPVFIPESYTCTVAELDPEIKNKISHRALAMANLKKFLI